MQSSALSLITEQNPWADWTSATSSDHTAAMPPHQSFAVVKRDTMGYPVAAAYFSNIEAAERRGIELKQRYRRAWSGRFTLRIEDIRSRSYVIDPFNPGAAAAAWNSRHYSQLEPLNERERSRRLRKADLTVALIAFTFLAMSFTPDLLKLF